VRDRITLARDRLDKTAGELVARREADRVNQDIQTVPVLAKFGKHRVDFLVARHVTGKQ
jgi:hypothetical protein